MPIQNDVYSIQITKPIREFENDSALEKNLTHENILINSLIKIANEFLPGLNQYDYKSLYKLWIKLYDEMHSLQLDENIGVFLYYTEDDMDSGKVQIQFCSAGEEVEEMNRLESLYNNNVCFIPYKHEFTNWEKKMESLKDQFKDLTGLFDKKNNQLNDLDENQNNEKSYEEIMTEVMSKRYFETYNSKIKEKE